MIEILKDSSKIAKNEYEAETEEGGKGKRKKEETINNIE